MRKTTKGDARRQRRHNKKRGFRPARSVPDIAKLSETTQLSAYQLSANTPYMKRDFTIATNPRAAAVANAYQHYRIKKITLKLKPLVDTFTGGVGYTAPYLYYMIDKSGSLPSNISLGALKSMGAKPIRLDEKEITISWRPSVLTNTVDLNTPGGAFSQYKVSPWLSTNANALNPGVFAVSNVDHLGIFMYIETVGASSLVITAECILDVEFKKPLNSSLTDPNNQEAVKL